MPMARLPGACLYLPGFNENTGWMHTSSRADAIDEYLETIVQQDDGYYYQYGDELRLEEKLIHLLATATRCRKLKLLPITPITDLSFGRKTGNGSPSA